MAREQLRRLVDQLDHADAKRLLMLRAMIPAPDAGRTSCLRSWDRSPAVAPMSRSERKRSCAASWARHRVRDRHRHASSNLPTWLLATKVDRRGPVCELAAQIVHEAGATTGEIARRRLLAATRHDKTMICDVQRCVALIERRYLA